MTIHEQAAKGFAAGVDAYELGRPSYSPEAVQRIVDELEIGPGKRVLDLAAGTGKLTRQLAPYGAAMVAVEPLAEMRAKLVEALPGLEILDGTAEDIPLPNHSVDAVVVGQGFHWFDGIRAVSEIRRVLNPDGAVAMIWQAREASEDWVRALEEIIDSVDDGHPRFRHGHWRDAFDQTAMFDPLEEAQYRHVQSGDIELFVDRVASISYVAALPAQQRRVVLDEVRQLLRTHPETAARDVIDLPYIAHVYWTRPRALAASPSTGLLVSVNTSPGGVPKVPIGAGRMRWRGVEGDGHDSPEPMHGTPDQAACLFPFEAIDRIRADGHQAFPGVYGDNFTVAGLDWKGLRTGDRLRLGKDGPLLLLTELATPCAKQARWFRGGKFGRMSVSRYPEDARWYASVLEEGAVAAGDEVRLIRTA